MCQVKDTQGGVIASMAAGRLASAGGRTPTHVEGRFSGAWNTTNARFLEIPFLLHFPQNMP